MKQLSESLQAKTWEAVYDCNDPDTAYDNFINEITNSIYCTIPEKDVVYSTTGRQFITNLRSSYTVGEDEICNTILKAIALDIIEPLTYCINLSYLELCRKEQKLQELYQSLNLGIKMT